jgi:hypothetical protein
VVEVVHDARGAFAARALAAGTYKLQIRTLDRSTAVVSFGLAPGERRELRVALEGPVTVRGVVLDGESGAPVAGVQVSATAGRIDMPLGFARVEGVTDGNGAFRLPDLWRHHTVVVQVNPGERPFRPERRRVSPLTGVGEVDVGAVLLARAQAR